MDRPSGRAAIKDGKGAISTKSGALKDYPYGFGSRFEGKPGTNPEELIGAAHAGCFTMALSLILGEAKLTAERMETTADVTLEKVADGFAITAVHLTLKAKVPGADQAHFEELAAKAEGRLSRFQAAECQDHPGRHAGRLITASFSRTYSAVTVSSGPSSLATTARRLSRNCEACLPPYACSKCLCASAQRF